MDRRDFLRAVGVLATMVGAGTYGVLNKHTDPAPEKPGKVLCDFHVHIKKNTPLENLLEVIGSPGLVGLAYREHENLWTYEAVASALVGKAEFKVITPGQLARYKVGYFARAQEVTTGKNEEGILHGVHFNVMGWEGDYFNYFRDPFDAIEEMRARGGTITLNHAYTIPAKLRWNISGSRLATKKEVQLAKDLCPLVDLLETPNANNVDLSYFFADNMEEADELARKLGESSCYKSTLIPPKFVASSDARLLEQVKAAGVYVPERHLTSMSRLTTALKSNQFEAYGGRVSIWSSLKGRGLPALKRALKN